MAGRSIRLFLVEGIPNGLITAEIGQWTGKAIVAPRQRLERLAERPEAKRTGVYVLMGPDPERDGVDRVYVGESENVFERIRQHDQKKEFWTRVCLFTAADENLTKAHVKHLESRLVEIALEAGRAAVDNGNTPPMSGLPEADRADMETFLEQARILLPVLGFSFTQPSASRAAASTAPDDASPVFALANVGVRARAREVDGEFVVYAGSTARKEGVPSWTAGKATRERLLEDGVLRDSPSAEYFEFAADHAFGSPSIAAAVVLGRNTNGREAWKIEGTGQSYAEWQAAKVAAAAAGGEEEG